MSERMRELKIDELERVVGGTRGSTAPPQPGAGSQAAYTPYGCNGCKLLEWWWPCFCL
jgi:hypothetical protein